MMLVITGGMKQSDHFCFPLHRKSHQNGSVVTTSVFYITCMTHAQTMSELVMFMKCEIVLVFKCVAV